jgi:hypothetical protein
MMDAGGKSSPANSINSSLLPVTDNSSSSSSADAAAIFGGDGSSATLTAKQELVLSNLVRVMAVINQHVAKQEEDRTTDFL